jgi:hypothetical protein
MNFFRAAFFAPALLIIAGCAKGPDAIAPVSMGNAFQATSCTQAREMLVIERQKLAGLSASQRGAVAGDAIGVFLIGVPVSSLSGNDMEGDIAASKGKVLALENRLSVGC